MLRSLRDNAKGGFLKYILMGFLVLAGGGLVLTDVGGFFRGGVAATDVAKVGDIKISAREFDTTVRNVLSRESIPPQQAYQLGLMDSLLQNIINNRLLNAAVADAGLRIGDEEVKRQIVEITKPMTMDGRSAKDVLQSILRQQNMSETQFIASLRSEAASALFQNSIRKGTSAIPDPLISVLYAANNEMRDVSVIAIDNDDIKNIDEPTDEDLAIFYETSKIQYLIPETRKITLAILNHEMLKDRIEISDEELQDIYDTDVASFTKPESRSIEQSIVSEQAQAETILKQAQDGKSLKQATQNVVGSDGGYQSSNDFEESGLIEDIAKPVFDAQEGDIIGPVQTPLGWHVLKLNTILKPEVTPFKDVKKDIHDALLNERLLDEMVDTANAVDDQLAGGETLANVVKEYGLTTQEIGPFRDTGLYGENNNDAFEDFMNDRNDIINTAFEYDTGEVAPILELSDGRFVSIRVDEITPMSYTPLEEVKSDLTTAWKDQQKALQNRVRAQELFTSIQENGDAFASAAKDAGASVKAYKGLKQSDPKDSQLPTDALAQLYELSIDDTFMTPYEGGYLIVKLTDVHIPSYADASDADKESVQNRVSRAIPNEVLNQYINTIAADKKISVNRALLDQMYGENSQAY